MHLLIATLLAAAAVPIDDATEVVGLSADGHWALVAAARTYWGVDLLRASTRPIPADDFDQLQTWGHDRRVAGVDPFTNPPSWPAWLRVSTTPKPSGKRRLVLQHLSTAPAVELVATVEDAALERTVLAAVAAEQLAVGTISVAKKARVALELYADAAHLEVAAKLAQRLGVPRVEPLTWKSAAPIVIALPEPGPLVQRALMPREADLVVEASPTTKVEWTTDGRFVLISEHERRVRMRKEWCLPGHETPVEAPTKLSVKDQASLESCAPVDLGDEEEEEFELRVVLDTWLGTRTEYPLADRILAFRGEAKSLQAHGGKLRVADFEAWLKSHPVAHSPPPANAEDLFIAYPWGAALPAQSVGFVEVDQLAISSRSERLRMHTTTQSDASVELITDPTGKRAVVSVNHGQFRVQAFTYPGSYSLAVVALAPTVEVQASASQLPVVVEKLEQAGFAVTRRIARQGLARSKLLMNVTFTSDAKKLAELMGPGFDPAPLTFGSFTGLVLYVAEK